MSNQFVVPFNNEPVETKQGSTSYTVPAGRYARVKVCIQCSAYVSNMSDVVVTSSVDSSSESDSKTFELWLNAGDVLGFSNTTASATDTESTGSARESFISSSSSAGITVDNGDGIEVVAIVRARAHLYCQLSANAGTVEIDGDAVGYYHAEEYTILS